jgi:hypothetical protein
MLNSLGARLRALLRRDRIGTEIDTELRFHVEMAIAANVAAGMTRRRAAGRCAISAA